MFDTALIVIDLQRDYFPGGKFTLPGIERTVERAAALIAMFRLSGMPVIHVRHMAKDPAVGFLLEGTAGTEIDPRVAPRDEDMLITKNCPNAFRDTTLAKILHVLGAKELFFCGAVSCQLTSGVNPLRLRASPQAESRCYTDYLTRPPYGPFRSDPDICYFYTRFCHCHAETCRQ